jgi:four helix bundle protein
MSNIAEGFERSGTPEFLHFLSMARSSCAEVRSQLYVALDIGYLDEPVFTKIMNLAEEVGRIVSGLRISVERQRKASTSVSRL